MLSHLHLMMRSLGRLLQPIKRSYCSALLRKLTSRVIYARYELIRHLFKLCSLSFFFVRLLLELVGGLLILFANFVEFLHVLKEVWASLESDEKLGLLAIAPIV